MKIVALLSFFDEPDHLLEECVASLRGVCDAVVAVDGRYFAYPADYHLSPPGNEAAIRAGADTAGIDAYVYREPGRPGPWLNEVAKRQAMFRLGERHTTDADWFLIIDADERVIDRGDVRERLEDTDLLSGLVLLMEDIGSVAAYPWLLKAARGITIGPAHYQYSLPDGRRLWCCYNRCVPSLDTHHDLMLEHRTRERSEAREARRWAYYLRRDSQQMEVPDLDPDIPEALGEFGADALAAGSPVAPGLEVARH